MGEVNVNPYPSQSIHLNDVKEANLPLTIDQRIENERQTIHFPEYEAGVAAPSERNVQANVNAKIYNPTRGGTSVQFLKDSFHKETEKTHQFCKKIIQTFSENATTVEDYEKIKTPSLAFIPIENLHVTLLAMGVVDASSEEDFLKKLVNNKAYRNLFIFHLQNPSSTLNEEKPITTLLNEVASANDPFEYLKSSIQKSALAAILERMESEEDFISSDLKEMLDDSPVILSAVELKITDNGSLVLQMAKSESLTKLKQTLVTIGGIAKTALGPFTASTIGFFPNFSSTSVEERMHLLEKIRVLNEEIRQQKPVVVVDNIAFVAFKRNTLGSAEIETQAIASSTRLSEMQSRFRYIA